MGAAVGLQVEPDDLDRPHGLDPGWQQVDLGPDQVGDCERLLAGKDVDSNVALGRQLGVHLLLDLVDELAAHPLEFEVHPAAAGLHVPAGDLRAVVAPDDAAQGVQGGVGPHQQEATRPIDVDLDLVTLGRELAVDRLELVADLPADLACAL